MSALLDSCYASHNCSLCHHNATCEIRNGVHGCYCNVGFTGPGIGDCYGKPVLFLSVSFELFPWVNVLSLSHSTWKGHMVEANSDDTVHIREPAMSNACSIPCFFLPHATPIFFIISGLPFCLNESVTHVIQPLVSHSDKTAMHTLVRKHRTNLLMPYCIVWTSQLLNSIVFYTL